MKYLFDTDAMSFFYDASRMPEHQYLLQHVGLLAEEDRIQVSVLTLCEFEYSYFAASSEKKPFIRKTISKIEASFDILPLTPNVAPIYGQMKSLLKSSKGRKPQEMKRYNVDVLIASAAISESSIVIGADTLYVEIAAVFPHFQYQNWLIA